MALKRQQYDLARYVDGGIEEHQVDVGPGDQLRAELEGKKLGLLPHGIAAAPLTFGSLCVYFAAVRHGLTEADFHTFINTEVYEFDTVKDDAGDPAQEPVGPTTSEGPSPSGSPSQPDSPELPTGSTPG